MVLALLRCGTIFSDVDPQEGHSAWTIAYNIALEIETALSGGSASFNVSTPITQADFVGGEYAISTAGSYHLAEPVTGNITVDQDNVYLNLNSFTCTGNITVATGNEKIRIRNGFVVDGYVLVGTSDYISLEDLVVSGENASVLQGTINLQVVNYSRVLRCHVTDAAPASAGIYLNSCDYNLIHGCSVVSIEGNNAYYLTAGSDYNVISECVAIDILGPDTEQVNGFYAQSSQGNLFIDCVAKNIAGAGASSVAIGFYLDGEDDTKIMNCIINGVSDETTENTNSRGIYVDAGCTNCLIRGNTVINSAGGIDGSSGVFGASAGNLALQNIAFNSAISSEVPNKQSYDPSISGDTTTYFHNVRVAIP